MSDKEFKINFKGQWLIVNEELYNYYRKSERKIKYMEEDIKFENIKVFKKAEKVTVIPSREDSFDKLCENGVQFKSHIETVEDFIIQKVSLDKALEKLSSEEYEIIYQLYYIDRTERQLANEMGINQTKLNRRKQKILCKLHELLKNSEK